MPDRCLKDRVHLSVADHSLGKTKMIMSGRVLQELAHDFIVWTNLL